MMSSIVAALLIVASVSTAQTDSTRHNPSMQSSIGNDALTGLRAFGHTLVAPTRWDGKDWLLAGGIVGATGISYSLDNTTFDLMERNHSSFNDDFSDIAAIYGSGYVAAGLPVTMYVTGLVFKDQWLRETAVLMGSTVLLTSAITTVGKFVAGRARPYAGFGRSEFKPFKSGATFKSFPSGHATASFAISAVLAARIKNPWASVGLYGAATITSISRLYTHDHWLSDIVFAAAYSTAVAHSVVGWFEEGDRGVEPDRSFNIEPSPNGLTITWRF
jgi:membrane-associated phospholipid phosphatase